MVGPVADRGAIGQGHDQRPERSPTGRALAGCLIDRIRRTPQPEQFIKYRPVGIHPHDAQILPHGGALIEPDPDIFGVGQVGDHGQVSAAEQTSVRCQFKGL